MCFAKTIVNANHFYSQSHSFWPLGTQAFGSAGEIEDFRAISRDNDLRSSRSREKGWAHITHEKASTHEPIWANVAQPKRINRLLVSISTVFQPNNPAHPINLAIHNKLCHQVQAHDTLIQAAQLIASIFQSSIFVSHFYSHISSIASILVHQIKIKSNFHKQVQFI